MKKVLFLLLRRHFYLSERMVKKKKSGFLNREAKVSLNQAKQLLTFDFQLFARALLVIDRPRCNKDMSP